MEKEKRFDIPTLARMFDSLARVTSGDWNIVRKLQQGVADGSVEVKQKEWLDSFRAKFNDPLDLAVIDTWSTYENCIDLTFSRKNGGKLTCDAVIFDGDFLDGRRTNARFKAELILPDVFIAELHDPIKWQFAQSLEDQHDEFLAQQRRDWMQQRADEITGAGRYEVESWR